MATTVILETNIPGLPKPRRGKVRDIYDLGKKLLIVSTDRISAFDQVLPNGIPLKGNLLNQLSLFWFNWLNVPHHLLPTDLWQISLPEDADVDPAMWNRSMVVHTTEVVPIECVVRGYLAGSGWKDYQKTGAVCGIRLTAGLAESAKLPEPIFTPATKAETGHDVNISFEQMANKVGQATAATLLQRSLDIYSKAAKYALARGIIIADTKFEFGWDDGELLLIDEVLTPDSSRFWPADQYEPGRGQPSFDKQYVRDWLETTDWDKDGPPPALPDEVVLKTRDKYIQAFNQLTGKKFACAE